MNDLINLITKQITALKGIDFTVYSEENLCVICDTVSNCLQTVINTPKIDLSLVLTDEEMGLNVPVIEPLKPLSEEQQTAFDAIVAFLQTNEPFFVLKGFAGTGKSFLLSHLARFINDPLNGLPKRISPVFCAPTNKATKVLKALLPDEKCLTIYSLLGLVMEQQEDKLVLAKSRDHSESNISYNVVFLDEGSMGGSQLMPYIEESQHYDQIKYILVGDPAQLPPVGEKSSPIWKLDCPKVFLTEVQRHDNQILDLVTDIRQVVTKKMNASKLRMKTNHTAKEGVWIMKEREFYERIDIYAKAKKFFDTAKCVAWRNDVVDHLNMRIRKTMFEPSLLTSKYIEGDKIVFCTPVNANMVMATVDEEGIIKESRSHYHSNHPDIKLHELVVLKEDGKLIEIQVVKDTSEDAFESLLKELAEQAHRLKGGPRRQAWDYFWETKNSVARIKHAYAITAHRSQGSTYREVFVHATDILSNRNHNEAYKCLYTATSRASTKLFIY